MRNYILVALLIGLSNSNAQNNKSGHGEYVFNSEKVDCITQLQKEVIFQKLNSNILELRASKKLFSDSQKMNVSFQWPVKKSRGSIYNEIWSISNYVDHNANFPNLLLDYDCSTRTYDTNNGYNHAGVDIFTWPFTYKMMDDDSAEVVAAASGQIIGKDDGNFDRNCMFNSSPWNAVYILHADGSIAWYGHLKNSSLTNKPVGATVSQGEYLGIVGSSGNSTGPHLHFEVYQDNTGTQLIDPYSGPCNNLNTQSWWQVQKPYNNPAINAALTHSAHPQFNFNLCGVSETTFESNQFDIGDNVYFYSYYRDQLTGSSSNVKIIRPDGTILLNENIISNVNYQASYWWWSRQVDMNGQWEWQVNFNNQTVSHFFNVGTLSSDSNSLIETSIYPNPVNNLLSIKTNATILKAIVYDLSGKAILRINENQITSINIENLTDGLYFLSLEDNQKNVKQIKFLKRTR